MAGSDGWTVTSQQTNQTVNDAAGMTVVGSYIYYRTNAGNEGVVFVTNNMLKPDHVKKVIEADARNIDAIGRLSNNPS